MSEPVECVICLRKTNAGACSSCESRMRQQLKDIVEFQALAPFNLIPGRGGDGRGSERSLGVNIQALDLVGGFDPIAVLESWNGTGARRLVWIGASSERVASAICMHADRDFSLPSVVVVEGVSVAPSDK